MPVSGLVFQYQTTTKNVESCLILEHSTPDRLVSPSCLCLCGLSNKSKAKKSLVKAIPTPGRNAAYGKLGSKQEGNLSMRQAEDGLGMLLERGV